MAGYYGEDNTALYGIPPVSGNTGGAGLDPELANLLTLISSVIEKPPLMPPPTPPMPQGTLRTVAGNLGDAIAAMAAVRAGGQAPQVGGFQASQMMRQQDYKKQQEDYLNRTAALESEGRTTRNAAKIGAISESQRQKSAEKVAGMKAQGRPLRFIPSTVTINGVPTRVTDVYDPMTGEHLGRAQEEEAGYAPFIQPAIPGVSPPVRIPRTGKAGTVEGGVTPPPPGRIVSDVVADKASLQAIQQMSDAYKKIRSVTKDQGLVEKAGKMLVGESRYGGAFKATKPYAEYKSTVRNSLNAYIKNVTGAQFSVAELTRYEALFPEPWDEEDTAATKIANLQQRALVDMQEKLKLYPAGGSPAVPESSSAETPEQRRKRLLEEYDAAHPE
jgi:hypothetical protein